MEDRRVLAAPLGGGDFFSEPFAGPGGESDWFDVAGSDLVVNTFADVIDASDGLLSLREAIIHANNTGDFRILLPAGNYHLTRDGGNENSAVRGDLDIMANVAVTIVAVKSTQAVIDAIDLGDRVFHVLAGSHLTLEGLTLTGGTTESNGPDPRRHGGGVLNQGTLTVINSTFTGNSANRDGCAIYNSNGTLTVRNGTISGNLSSRESGGIFSTGGALTLTNSTLYNNTASVSGGIRVDSGSPVLNNTIVAGNRLSNGAASDISGTVTAASSYNLIGTGGSGGLVQDTNGNIVLP